MADQKDGVPEVSSSKLLLRRFNPFVDGSVVVARRLDLDHLPVRQKLLQALSGRRLRHLQLMLKMLRFKASKALGYLLDVERRSPSLHHREFPHRTVQLEVQPTRDEGDEQRVLGDALSLSGVRHSGSEIGGEAYEFVGGHVAEDSTCASEFVLVSALSTETRLAVCHHPAALAIGGHQ